MTNTERDHLREAVPVAWACRHETAGDELEWHHPTIPALTKDDIENGWTMEPLFSAAALASNPALDPATIEHCAKIADEWMQNSAFAGDCDTEIKQSTGRQIAAAIRASVEQQATPDTE